MALYGPTSRAPWPIVHNNQQEWEFQITIFAFKNLILSSNCTAENKEVVIFLDTLGTGLPGKCLSAYVFGPWGSKIIKQQIRWRRHSVSFRPTSFPQLLSEMSGLAPQGMRSWGNGVRTEGAEQPERDWEGGLREWMRLWEQSREGVLALNTFSTLVASLSLYPFPLSA